MLKSLLAVALLITSVPNAIANGTSAVDGKPSVLCTTGMIADVARHLAGDRAEVTSMMGAGVDPHLYRPTRSDIADLLRADVILYNGLLLEGKLTDALTRARRAGRTVVAVGEAIDEGRLLSDPETEGHPDPHVWMDPTRWSSVIPVIEAALMERDPDGSEVYRRNAEAYRAELERLDAYAQRVLGSIPEKQRVLVTAHDAFEYLGDRYGMEVLGIQGISTESEAGLRDIERLVDTLVTREISAVFVESTVSDRNVRALVEGAGARGHEVTIGGELFSDAMGRPGTYRGTYVGMIDHNLTTIARALGGEAPQGGLNGKLSPE